MNREIALTSFLLGWILRWVGAVETCSEVVVAGGYPGTYTIVDGLVSSFSSGETSLLQPIPFGNGRRKLIESQWGVLRGTNANSGLKGNGQQRMLADEEPCDSQLWVLADEASMSNGFPFYATFDCEAHPVDITSEWVFVECETCAMTAEVQVTCSDGLENAASTNGESGKNGLSNVALGGVIVGGVAAVALVGMVGFLSIRKLRR